MTVQYRTPGVYVQELDAFPPSIVGVETAVPVFIGYTEKAEQGGRPVNLKPVRVGSMVEYAAIFGGAYTYKFTVRKATTAADMDVKIGGDHYQLVADKNFNLYYCLRLFYANGGGECYIVSVGSYDADPAPDYNALSNGLAAVRDLVGPTMLVIPGAASLERKEDHDKLVAEMLKQCSDKQDRVAILDVWGTDGKPHVDFVDFNGAIDYFRSHSVSGPSEYLKYGMAYAPFLKTSIVDPSEVSFKNFRDFDPQPGQQSDDLIAALEKEVNQLYPDQPTLASPPQSPPTSPPELTTQGQKLKVYYSGELAKINASPPISHDEKAKRIAQLSQNLIAQIPVFKDIYAAMAAKIGTLPASPAVAGVYTANDALRGVWNAPANVGLVAVTEPTIRINTEMQNDLNMPINGLAVNAIRDFPGRGTLVWGARTLDGNSNDWRYIQVRRALIYIEQSVELALNKFVFEPNVAQTWVTVTAMIGSFLRGVWQAGGLMGATPQEAFSVQCGLGSTMTAQDVLEGRMNVQIKLQMVHPAEFIVLVFQQQMQGGAG